MDSTGVLDRLTDDETDAALDLLEHAFRKDPNVHITFSSSIPGLGNGEAFYKEFGERTQDDQPIYRLMVFTGYGQIINEKTVEETLDMIRAAVHERTSGRHNGKSASWHEGMYNAQVEELIAEIEKANPTSVREGEKATTPFPLSATYSLPGRIPEPSNGASVRAGAPIQLNVVIGYGLGSAKVTLLAADR